MDYDEACHTNGEMWSVIYRTLKEIREVRELLCTDELEKVSQKMELIEKEIDILSVLIFYLWQYVTMYCVFCEWCVMCKALKQINKKDDG